MVEVALTDDKFLPLSTSQRDECEHVNVHPMLRYGDCGINSFDTNRGDWNPDIAELVVVLSRAEEHWSTAPVSMQFYGMKEESHAGDHLRTLSPGVLARSDDFDVTQEKRERYLSWRRPVYASR